MPVHQPSPNVAKAFAGHMLSPDKLGHILNLSAADPNLRDLHDIATILSNTGLRRGELQELRWTDMDIRGLSLNVQWRGGLRQVPFGPKTLKIFEARRKREVKSEYVFGASRKVLWNKVSRQFRGLCDAAGLKPVSLRTLRITFFSRLVCSGANIVSIARIAGLRSRAAMEAHVSRDTLDESFLRDLARLEEYS